MLVNSPGYRISRRPRPLPQWHDYHTGEATDQDPAHVVFCGRGCVELELTFTDWSINDEPVLRLAMNPSRIWTDTYFPMQCSRGAAGMVCRVRMMTGTTTVVDIPRYTIMPGTTRGTHIDVPGRIFGRYREEPICVSRIGIGLYAIQAPLVYTDGTIAGSSHTWCETYTHP
jgi:hypothetical protein